MVSKFLFHYVSTICPGRDRTGTMSKQQRTISQTKDAQLRSYQKRLKDDIKGMVDNYMEIMKLVKVEEESQVSRPTKSEQDQFEMEVRAANIVRAGESLMKLFSDIKQFLILNDFRAVNEAILQNTTSWRQQQNIMDNKLLNLRDDMATDLYELEEEYYSSVYK
ncbi:hypothetical protein LSH36_156g08017 [Paralvinella palmiformis]|uniref:Mediator of RNA polymerase II transcription subunit 22 n=1 Tax=Paralvinella palmiformis TaxID=53620 RepID=A0AAD9JU70_9ANNE|nr:hypothetical protein LSH36_156g08017 [Paralvinella palmiformis]